MYTNLFIIFSTGLLTGGLTCLAVQGGLLASMLAQQEEERLEEGGPRKGNVLPIIYFLAAKLVAYSILGFFLGLLGSVLELSITASLVLQFAVIIFMLGTAGNLLNLHPFFRYFIIQPPRFLTKLVRSQSKSRSIFAPVLLGAFTILIPCGTTQAMMALAISSGNSFQGFAIMFAFILGTIPTFFLLGYFMTKLGDALQKKFYKFAAVAIIILALWSLNGALALAGVKNFTSIFNSLTTPNYLVEPIPGSGGVGTPADSKADNNPTIYITSSGYSPRTLTVEAGANVKLKLVNEDGYSCAQSLVIPSLNLRASIPPGVTKYLEFTAPLELGKIPFMCSMGMYRGTINVVAATSN